MRPEASPNCYSNHLCLLDSASSQNLIDKGFLKSEFPNIVVQPVQSTMQLACSSTIIDINAKVTLDVIFGATASKIRILLDFYVIPELCNQITLGLPFFLNRHFDSMTADSVKLNPDISSVLIRASSAKKAQLPPLLCIPITYVGTQVNLNSFAKVECLESKSDSHPDDSLAVRESLDQAGIHAGIECTNFRKSFEHVFRKYDIDSDDIAPLYDDFNKTGKFSIPVDKVVEQIPLDYFDSNKKIYYRTMPELIRLLDLDHVPDPFRSKIINFVVNHSSLFSKSPTDVGLVKNFKVSIELNNCRKDICMKQYNIPYKIRASAQSVLIDYEKAGIIERFQGENPIISNLICLKKPNTTDEYRLALDCRFLNALYPCRRNVITSVTEVLRQLPSKADHYSMVDISASYHSIELDQRSRRNFCFYGPNNILYCLRRLAMGFIEASSFLYQALNNILTDNGTKSTPAILYIDDILLASDHSLEKYVEELIDLLRKLYLSGIKINPRKIQILRNTVTFLGYGLKKGQFNISDEKIRAFTELPVPRTRLSLRYYLNSCAYFRTSIPGFASHTACLYDLVNQSDPSRKKHRPFRFEQKHQIAFENLREQIKNFLPLSNANYSHGFYLMTDANTTAVSFLLFQLDYSKITEKQEEEMDFRKISNLERLEHLPKRFILCGSKKLSPHLKTQSIFKLELLSVLYALKTTRTITLFNDLKLFTDCKSILHVRLSKTQSPELMRASLLLSSFRISLYHLPRSLNVFSDLLGRGEDKAEQSEPYRSLTTPESDAFLKCLLIPDDLKVTSQNFQKLLLQESPKAILESIRKTKDKSMIKSEQITDKPSLKSKRKIKPFDIVISNDKIQRIVKVSMVREVGDTSREAENQNNYDDPIPGPSGLQSSRSRKGHDTDFCDVDPETDHYNSLESTRCLAETFCRGLMSVENFISCQQNDIAIQNYTGKTQVVAGIICVVRKTSVVDKRRIRAICPIAILESFARTLHHSHQNFHASPRQIIKIIQKDFYILDEKVVYDEIGKCIACLTSEQDMNTAQSFAENKLPSAIRISLNFDIVSGLPITESKNRYIYSCCDS